MTRVVVDQSWMATLGGLSGEVELCQENGQTIGFFLPAASREKVYAWAKGRFSREELDQAAHETGGRPLADILKDLERQ